MKEYEITYRSSYVGFEGWVCVGHECTFRCHAKSKSKALIMLINQVPVYRILKIERVKSKKQEEKNE